MTQLTVNFKCLSMEFNANSTVGEIAQEILLSSSHGDDAIITGINVDNIHYNFERGLDLLDRSIGGFENINFDISFKSKIFSGAIEGLNTAIDYMSSNIRRFTEAYRAGKSDQLQPIFAELVEHLELFVALFLKLKSTYRALGQSNPFCTPFYDKLERALLENLKLVIHAKENSDFVMLCDLLEYDLVDTLLEWKAGILQGYHQEK